MSTLPADYGVLIGGALSLPRRRSFLGSTRARSATPCSSPDSAPRRSTPGRSPRCARRARRCSSSSRRCPTPPAEDVRRREPVWHPRLRQGDLSHRADRRGDHRDDRAGDREARPRDVMPVFALHGAVADLGRRHGLRWAAHAALRGRASAVSADAEVFAADRTWVRSVWDALSPLSANAGSTSTHLRAGRRRARPRVVRTGEVWAARTDQGHLRPGNVFHRNANIKPA